MLATRAPTPAITLIHSFRSRNSDTRKQVRLSPIQASGDHIPRSAERLVLIRRREALRSPLSVFPQNQHRPPFPIAQVSAHRCAQCQPHIKHAGRGTRKRQPACGTTAECRITYRSGCKLYQPAPCNGPDTRQSSCVTFDLTQPGPPNAPPVMCVNFRTCCSCQAENAPSAASPPAFLLCDACRGARSRTFMGTRTVI